MGICFGRCYKRLRYKCLSKATKELLAIYSDHQEELNALRFYERETEALYNMFKTIDKKKIQWISIQSLFNFIEIEESNFTRTVFSSYDKENTGFICFRDFFIISWNICTIGVIPLVEFLFSLYDSDGSKTLSLEEGLTMITDLFGNNFRDNPDAFRVYREVQVQIRKNITFSIFTHIVKINPMVLTHVKEFQLAMRNKILSMDFWIRAGKRRTEAFGPKLYISPEMIFEKAKARMYRPPMPEEVLKYKQKERRKVEDGDNIEVSEVKKVEVGSKEWKEMRLTKNNPQFHGKGLNAIPISSEISSAKLVSVSSTEENREENLPIVTNTLALTSSKSKKGKDSSRGTSVKTINQVIPTVEM